MSQLVYVVGVLIGRDGQPAGTITTDPTTPEALRQLGYRVKLHKEAGDACSGPPPPPSQAAPIPYRIAEEEPSPRQGHLFEARHDHPDLAESPAEYSSTSRTGTTRDPDAWRRLAKAVDKHAPDSERLTACLAALGITAPESLIERHGDARVAHVIRCAAAKRGKIREPKAWILQALKDRWGLDPY